jgi:hypothetical protein
VKGFDLSAYILAAMTATSISISNIGSTRQVHQEELKDHLLISHQTLVHHNHLILIFEQDIQYPFYQTANN